MAVFPSSLFLYDQTVQSTPPTPTRLTGRQKVALMLANAGYPHSEIARRLGISHRQAASRLIARARAAQKALSQAAEQFLES